MKKLTLFVAVSFATLSYGVSYEYYQLYKDPKLMGAGGAGVATGGSFSALFSNPAGLSRIPKEYGWEFQILNVSTSVNDNVGDFKKIKDAADESETKLAETIKKYTGENFHISINAIPLSVAKKFDTVAFGVGGFGSANVSFMPHSGFGSSGIIEGNGFTVAGAAVGASKDIRGVSVAGYELNDIVVGAGLKGVKYGSISKTFSAADIADKEFKLEDELIKGNSVVADLGVIYTVYPRVDFGISAMNIGGVGDKGEDFVPSTINLGLSYNYRVNRSFFNQVRVSTDLIDITKQYNDDSFTKRTRFGADLNVWDGWFSTFSIQAGLYQGEYTAGFNLRVVTVDLGFATYEEQLGAYKGQDSDRRYMTSFGINW